MSKASKATIFSLALLAAGCASMQPPAATVEAPEKLRPGPNESLAMITAARGVQIYECRPAKDRAGEYDWAFVAPQADLYDAHGARIGLHYAGPQWESADGSKVLGTVKEHADAPAADAIPWLLLTAKSVGPEGSFSNVTSVQRLNTVGGLAPKGGCFEAEAGTRLHVGYTADYYFFTQRPMAVGSQDSGMY